MKPDSHCPVPIGSAALPSGDEVRAPEKPHLDSSFTLKLVMVPALIGAVHLAQPGGIKIIVQVHRQAGGAAAIGVHHVEGVAVAKGHSEGDVPAVR